MISLTNLIALIDSKYSVFVKERKGRIHGWGAILSLVSADEHRWCTRLYHSAQQLDGVFCHPGRTTSLSLSLCPPLAIIVRQTDYSSPVHNYAHSSRPLNGARRRTPTFSPLRIFSRPFSLFVLLLYRPFYITRHQCSCLPTSRTVLFVFGARGMRW